MMSADFRNQCFTDFLNGLSMRKIAEKHSVSSRTIERWARTEGWMNKRRFTWHETQMKISEQLVNSRLKKDKSVAGRLHKVLVDVAAQYEAFHQGTLPKKAITLSLREITSLAKAIKEVGAYEERRTIDQIAKAKRNLEGKSKII